MISDERARLERERLDSPDPVRSGDVYYWRGAARALLDDREELLRTITILKSQMWSGSERVEKLERVVWSIAQYHPDWKGQRVNNAPNRAQLIDMAFDAFRTLDEEEA